MKPGPRGTAAGRGTHAFALAALMCLAILAGCQSSGPSPRTTAGASIIAASPSPATSPSPSVDTVAVDPTLLSILPRDVGGALMLPAPDNATDIAHDPSLVPEVEALAVALAVGAGSSDNEDLVIANVVRLRPDVFDDTFFEGWRATYDEAACEPAGGVRGSTEDEIASRQVFIGTCVNGGSTYHVRYGEDVIVSVTSTGDGDFGRIVMEHLGA